MSILIRISKRVQQNFGSSANKPASNSDNSGFEYWRLNRLQIFLFLSSSWKVAGFYQKLGHGHLFPSRYSLIVNCGSSVSVVTRLRTGKPRNRSSSKFSLLQSNNSGSGAYPTSYTLNIGGSISRVKRPDRTADHLPLTSADGRNEWSYTSSLTYTFFLCTGTRLLSRLISKLVTAPLKNT
jgi:hypothetical protein